MKAREEPHVRAQGTVGLAFALTLPQQLQCDEVKSPTWAPECLLFQQKTLRSFRCVALECRGMVLRHSQDQGTGDENQNILSRFKGHTPDASTRTGRAFMSAQTRRSLPTKMQRELRAICDGAEPNKFEQRQPGHPHASSPPHKVLMTLFQTWSLQR